MTESRNSKEILARITHHEESTGQKVRHEKLHSSLEVQQHHRSSDALPNNLYDTLQKNQKIIPGYNFESLFRKKSHIRLARKKNKEEPQKRNSSMKVEGLEKEAKNIQKGHWTQQENKLYHWFLQLHNKHFVLKYLRRTDKIFKSMANFIQTREAEQCRSHHQKMQKKYHTFYQILIKLRIQFYNSTSSEALKSELQDNGYKIKQSTLLSESELKDGDLLNKSCQPDDNQEQSFKNNISNQQGSLNQHSNLLGENYERALHFKHINY